MIKVLTYILKNDILGDKSTPSIRKMCSSKENILKNLFLESVQSVQPQALIKNQVKLHECHLTVKQQTFTLSKPCYIVGFGKAVLGMVVELETTLQDHLERAIVAVPKGIFETYPAVLKDSKKIEWIEGAKDNLPDEESLEGARRIMRLVKELKEDDLLIVLISGGGSSLLPLPKPPITLQEKQTLIRSLSRTGANIHELNSVRKHLSVLKGGGLAEMAYPCRVVSLILSDVVGDPLDIIASGPTVPCEESSEEAIKILRHYSLFDETPISIMAVLENEKPENQSNQQKSVTLSSDGNFPHVSNFIIGNNKIATQTARALAIKSNFQSVVMSRKIEGDVNRLGETYAQLARNIVLIMDNTTSEKNKLTLKYFLEKSLLDIKEAKVLDLLSLDFSQPIILIFAGEPTVCVQGNGKGGRNQQLALAFSIELNKLEIKSGNISFLSGGTDGVDGPTDAAGAIGTSGLVEICSRTGINPSEYLENNDSYGFYSRFEGGEYLVKVGHTGTNVMDLHFLMIESK